MRPLVRFIQLIKMYVYNASDPADEDEDDEEEGVKGPCRREAIVIERPLLTQAFGMICKRGAQVSRSAALRNVRRSLSFVAFAGWSKSRCKGLIYALADT